MPSLQSFLSVVHLIGLALGLGCATAKLALLLRSRADQEFGPTFIKVSKPMTRLIIVGLSLLTLSGIGWLLLGYSFTPILVAKLALVVVIWILGPIIDNVVEPKFKQLAPGPGESASADFLRVQRRYLMMEITATALFYVITVMWVLT